MAHIGQRDAVDAHHQRVVTLILLNQLQGAGLVGVAAVDRVAQEQHHGLVAGELRCLVDGMAEAALLTLIDIVQALADVEDVGLILPGLGIELAEMLVGEGPLEVVGILLALLLGAEHEAYLLDAALDELFEQDEDDGPHHAIMTRYGEEILLQGTGGRIEPGAKACHGNDGAAHGVDRLQRKLIGLQAAVVEIVDELVLGLGAAGEELHGAVAVGADTLAAPHKPLHIGILQHAMELGRPQGRRHRRHLRVEEGLGLGHQPAQGLHLAFCHVADGTVYDVEVLLAEGLVLSTVGIGRGKRVGLVQVGEDLDSVLLGTEVGKDPIKVLLHIQRAHLDLITVEGHQIRLHAEGAGLVETSTAARCAQLAQVGNVHLAQGVQIQII